MLFRSGESDVSLDGDDAQAMRSLAAAHQRSDHRGVLRLWTSLKRSDQVPATTLAQVVEAMQRFKKDSASIIGEVKGYLKRNAALCNIQYVNRLLEPLAKSLDAEVVFGIVSTLASLDLSPDAGTYELLIQMHFTTRSFDEVVALDEQMRTRGIIPTRRTNLALLKTRLQLGHLDNALEHFREVGDSFRDLRTTASSAPRHITAQLVELGCREHRIATVLEALEEQQVLQIGRASCRERV